MTITLVTVHHVDAIGVYTAGITSTLVDVNPASGSRESRQTGTSENVQALRTGPPVQTGKT